jgi:biotin-(acetyl-CoA carboxylase) ligase
MNEEDLLLISTPATSLYIETGKPVNKEAVFNSLSHHVKHSLDILLEKGFSYFWQDLDRLLMYKGKHVEIVLGSHAIVQGKVMGIDKDGALLLQMSTGDILKTFSGRILKVMNE